MSDGQHRRLTRDQIVQVNSICNRFERAWQLGQAPSIEAAAAGADSLVRAALLQHLAELDIQCRVNRGNDVDLEVYLSRWPDLHRAALQAALEAAQKTGATSIFAGAASTMAAAKQAPQICSVDDFLKRLRDSRLLPDAEVDTLARSASGESSSTAMGMKLIEARKLTSFQVTSLLEGTGDPLTLGEYVVQDLVGRGGMGTVYRAIHRRMKRTVALKVLRRDIPHADVLAKRFVREVEVAARLCHPNIVTAYDAGEQNGVSYLVSEFVEGQNLGDLVKQYGPLSLPLAVDVVQQAARALEYAHGEGVIHRDIKPSNLLLDDAGNVKLLDVGLARINQPEMSETEANSDLTTTGMIMGTVDYMSPEQAQNTRLADERSDVYSLGCTLYFLITGRAPYAKGTGIERLLAHREQPIPSFRALSSAIPAELDELLTSLLQKKPTDRLPSMAELVGRLESLKAVGIPDMTLPLTTIEEDFDGPVTAESPVPSTELVAISNIADSDMTQTPVSAVSEYEALSGVPEIRVDDEWRKSASMSGKPAQHKTSTPLSLLPWIVVPGLVAVGVLAMFFKPEGVSKNEATGIPNLPDIERLSDMSEDQVQAYRSRWATALGTDEEQTIKGVTFLLIPPGRFIYGEGPDAVETTVNDEFYLSETEVTHGQFRAFVAADGNYRTIAERNGTGWGRVGGKWIQGPDYNWKNLGENFVNDSTPAASIAYPDAVAYCEWLSSEIGRTVRLPTEVEWEYACRCGRRDRWSFGNDSSLLDDYAWTRSNSNLEIHPVRSLLPNAWGLYDMHGNEFEWCFAENAQAPEFAGTGTIRGGGFASQPFETPCSVRTSAILNEPTHGAFRVLMERVK